MRESALALNPRSAQTAAVPAQALAAVLTEARACRVCAAQLPHGCRPVLRADARARVLLIGQAPGRKVHASGIDWNDASGDRLRAWLGIDTDTFYGPKVAVVPMGFCYPGKGPSGDLPPRPECAPLWHPRLLPLLPNVRLTVLVGAYAQQHLLGEANRATLTDTVRAFASYLPRLLPLPHPSPRNGIWLRKNPWFDAEVLPALRLRVAAALR